MPSLHWLFFGGHLGFPVFLCGGLLSLSALAVLWRPSRFPGRFFGWGVWGGGAYYPSLHWLLFDGHLGFPGRIIFWVGVYYPPPKRQVSAVLMGRNN